MERIKTSRLGPDGKNRMVRILTKSNDGLFKLNGVNHDELSYNYRDNYEGAPINTTITVAQYPVCDETLCCIYFPRAYGAIRSVKSPSPDQDKAILTYLSQTIRAAVNVLHNTKQQYAYSIAGWEKYATRDPNVTGK